MIESGQFQGECQSSQKRIVVSFVLDGRIDGRIDGMVFWLCLSFVQSTEIDRQKGITHEGEIDRCGRR